MAPRTGDAKRPARTAGRPLGKRALRRSDQDDPVDGMGLLCDETKVLNWADKPTPLAWRHSLANMFSTWSIEQITPCVSGFSGGAFSEHRLDGNVSLKYHYDMKTELVTNLKRQATRILSDMRESGESVLITEHGKPSAYLVDVDSFEFMQSKLRVLEGIVRGERAVLDGRTYSEEEAKQKMSKWLD